VGRGKKERKNVAFGFGVFQRFTEEKRRTTMENTSVKKKSELRWGGGGGKSEATARKTRIAFRRGNSTTKRQGGATEAEERRPGNPRGKKGLHDSSGKMTRGACSSGSGGWEATVSTGTGGTANGGNKGKKGQEEDLPAWVKLYRPGTMITGNADKISWGQDA